MTAQQKIASLSPSCSTKRSATHGTMKQTAFALFLFISWNVLGSSYKLPGKDETLDVTVNKQPERFDVETLPVGEAPRTITHGLRGGANSLERVEDEAEWYFFDKIVKAIKAVGAGVDNAFEAVKNKIITGVYLAKVALGTA